MKRHFALVIVCLLVLVKSSHQKWSCYDMDTSNVDSVSSKTLDNCIAMAVPQACAMYQNVTGIMNKLSPDGKTKFKAAWQSMEEIGRSYAVDKLNSYLDEHRSDPYVQNFMQDNSNYPALLNYMGFQTDNLDRITIKPNTQATDFCYSPAQFQTFLTNDLTSAEKKVLFETVSYVGKGMKKDAPTILSTVMSKNYRSFMELSQQDQQIIQTYFVPYLNKAVSSQSN